MGAPVPATDPATSAPAPDPTCADRVRLLAFAAVRDVIGEAEVDLDLGGARTADELWPVLLGRYPALAPHRPSIRIAVNGTYAFPHDPVRRGDEVALIPPVAGG